MPGRTGAGTGALLLLESIAAVVEESGTYWSDGGPRVVLEERGRPAPIVPDKPRHGPLGFRDEEGGQRREMRARPAMWVERRVDTRA